MISKIVFPQKCQIRNVASIYLARRDPVHNRQRFYAITVTRTRFDGWALVREWGRIGQPGTVRETWFETESAARAAGEWCAKSRQRGKKGGGNGNRCQCTAATQPSSIVWFLWRCMR